MVLLFCTGTVRSGLPPFSVPPFSTVLGNQTYSFAEMCSELGSSIILVPIISVLGNVAIAKAFCKLTSVLICICDVTGRSSSDGWLVIVMCGRVHRKKLVALCISSWSRNCLTFVCVLVS